MKNRVCIGCAFISLLVVFVIFANADIVILKNGQVLRDVTIRDDGDTLYCKNNDQSFFINKNTVESIIQTGPKTFFVTAKNFITSLPRRTRLFVKNYFAFTATIIGILMLLLTLIIFKTLWINISPIFKEGIRRRDVIKAIKQLDANEKSVLREFYIQRANTLEMPVEDIVVSGLIKNGILQTTQDKGQYSTGGLLLPVTILPAVKKRIKPDKIGMPANLDDPKARKALSKSRPQYMYEMAEFYQSLEKSNSDRSE